LQEEEDADDEDHKYIQNIKNTFSNKLRNSKISSKQQKNFFNTISIIKGKNIKNTRSNFLNNSE
jgi:hypothetical protein